MVFHLMGRGQHTETDNHSHLLVITTNLPKIHVFGQPQGHALSQKRVRESMQNPPRKAQASRQTGPSFCEL